MYNLCLEVLTAHLLGFSISFYRHTIDKAVLGTILDHGTREESEVVFFRISTVTFSAYIG